MQNSKIAIVTDSTSDLSPELIKEHDLHVLPLGVNFTFGGFFDGVDINTRELYALVEKHNELPKTAALNPGAIYECFNALIAKGYDILFCGISSSMSKTYENALFAASEFPDGRIAVVDSKNLSSGIGISLLHASRLRKEGHSLKEIADRLEKITSNIRSQFAIETMEYLHRGGRCSGVARFIGSVLKLRPIIAVREGKMSVAKMPRGKMKTALDAMIKMLLHDVDNLSDSCIFITHSLGHEYVDYLVENIKAISNSPIHVTEAGCVISSHCGPSTIGILYLLEDEVSG